MEVSTWDIQACIANIFSKRQSVTCANLLSNTAQALTSFVEALQDASNATDPLPFLEEALDLFQKCLEHQELQHQDFEEQSAAAAAIGAQDVDTDDGGVSLTTGSTMDFESEVGMYFLPIFECSINLFNLKIIFIEHKSWNMQIPFFLIDPLLWYNAYSTLHSYPFNESCLTFGDALISCSSRGRPLVSLSNSTLLL